MKSYLMLSVLLTNVFVSTAGIAGDEPGSNSPGKGKFALRQQGQGRPQLRDAMAHRMPLMLALDEIGNLSPLPSLPVLMAEGGGTGITTMPVLQSLSQARDKWGDHAAGAIWDASIAKIILGGTSSARDLQDLSALIGERDEKTDTISIGDYGSRSLQRSTRRVPILPPEAIRTLPFGTALVLLRSSSPLVTDLRPWTARTDATIVRSSRNQTEGMLRNHAAR